MSAFEKTAASDHTDTAAYQASKSPGVRQGLPYLYRPTVYFRYGKGIAY